MGGTTLSWSHSISAKRFTYTAIRSTNGEQRTVARENSRVCHAYLRLLLADPPSVF